MRPDLDRSPHGSSSRATPADIVRLVEAEPHPIRRALLAVLYGCALRASEATALRWSDLIGDGAAKRVMVTGPGGDARAVPVPTFTLRHLDAVRPALTSGGLMFPSYEGTRLTEHQVGGTVIEAGRRVGRPDIRGANRLRGLRARHLIDGGASERAVRIFLGSLAHVERHRAAASHAGPILTAPAGRRTPGTPPPRPAPAPAPAGDQRSRW